MISKIFIGFAFILFPALCVMTFESWWGIIPGLFVAVAAVQGADKMRHPQ